MSNKDYYNIQQIVELNAGPITATQNPVPQEESAPSEDQQQKKDGEEEEEEEEKYVQM